MNKNSRKIDALLAFGLNIIFLFFFMCFYELIHEANDDLAISFMLEGAYGDYSEFVVYQNTLWAKCVIFLNQLIPQVKWYMVIMFFMAFANFTGVSYVFFRTYGRKMGFIVNSVLLLFCGYHTYVIFQYSRIAAVVSAGGMILIFYALEHALCKKEKWLFVIAGAFLALWGSMIRFPMFGVAVALAGGAIGFYKVWSLFREKQAGWQKQIGVYVAVFGLVGILSLGLYVYDKLQYSTDAYWAQYVEYNDIRTELYDYGFPDYRENYELYQSLGISEIDYAYYRYWNIDPENLTMDVLYAIAETKGEKTFAVSSFFEVFPKLFEQYNIYSLFVIFAIVAICLKRKNLYFAIYGFCGVMAFEALFMYLGRCGWARIDCGMWMAALLALAYGAAEDVAKLKDVSWKWVPAVIAMAVVLNNAHLGQVTHEMSGATGSTKDIYEIVSSDKEHLYIVLSWGPSVYFGYDFWEPCEKGELSNVYNAYGWEQKMKVKDAILENYGISNIYRDSINNEKVYFMVGEQVDITQRFLRENYDPNAYLSYESEINGVALWSIKTSE